MLASQSKMAARAPVRALACLSSPAFHPDTEGGAHSSTWAIIWPREGGGGGAGAAASSRWQILASQSKMARLASPAVLWCVAWVASDAVSRLSQKDIESLRRLPLTLTLTLTLTQRTQSIHRELVSTDR